MTVDVALAVGWCLVVFRERYGGGGWRALIAADMELAALVEGELCGDDIGAVEMERYLGNAGGWFPTACGDSPSKALAVLGERLAIVPGDQVGRWRELVRNAWEAVRDAHRAAGDDAWWIGRALDEGRLTVVE